MRTQVGVVLLVLLLALPVSVPGVVAANDEVDPRFETTVPEPVLQPGATQQLTVTVSNDAANYEDRAEPALDVTARVSSVAGIDVLSGERNLGRMDDGTTRQVAVTIDVPANIPAGTYDIPIKLTYRDTDARDELKETTVTATVRVQERARFAIRSTNSAAPVDGSGTVAVTIENVGSQPATDAVVQFRSSNAELTFGGAATARRFVGDFAPGETRTVAVDAKVAQTAEVRPYAVDAVVEYTTPEGTLATSRPLVFGVQPLPEQTFAIGELESTLRVGDEGQVRGTVTNTGERPVYNAVVRFETTSPNVSPLEPEVAIGTLEPGESADVAFDVEVSDAAEAGPRQFTLRVDYRNQAGDSRTSDTLDAPVTVAESRDEFSVAVVDGSLPAGSPGTLTLAVTNERDSTVEDVSAKLFLDAPLSSADDEGFINSLDPGETARVKFDLSMAGSAVVNKSYPIELDFRYETSEGDTRISDTYRVPVTATESSGSGLPFGVTLPVAGGLVVLIVVLGGAAVLFRR